MWFTAQYWGSRCHLVYWNWYCTYVVSEHTGEALLTLYSLLNKKQDLRPEPKDVLRDLVLQYLDSGAYGRRDSNAILRQLPI